MGAILAFLPYKKINVLETLSGDEAHFFRQLCLKQLYLESLQDEAH